MSESSDTNTCLDCGSQRVHKPIAHVETLHDPLGHLCFRCYASWVQLSDYDEECVICGEDVEYCTVREIPDTDGNPVLTTGQLGACEEHILECVDVRVSRPKRIH